MFLKIKICLEGYEMKTLYFDCSSGISGNMTLGALLEIIGGDNFLLNELKKLNVDGYKIEISSKEKIGNIAICTGGTADIPVAEEAAETLEFFGNYVERIYDVGVAGLHRILSQIEKLEKANCIIVIAGMEGALASVVGGMSKVPVIAVPTSIKKIKKSCSMLFRRNRFQFFTIFCK